MHSLQIVTHAPAGGAENRPLFTLMLLHCKHGHGSAWLLKPQAGRVASPHSTGVTLLVADDATGHIPHPTAQGGDLASTTHAAVTVHAVIALALPCHQAPASRSETGLMMVEHAHHCYRQASKCCSLARKARGLETQAPAGAVTTQQRRALQAQPTGPQPHPPLHPTSVTAPAGASMALKGPSATFSFLIGQGVTGCRSVQGRAGCAPHACCSPVPHLLPHGSGSSAVTAKPHPFSGRGLPSAKRPLPKAALPLLTQPAVFRAAQLADFTAVHQGKPLPKTDPTNMLYLISGRLH